MAMDKMARPLTQCLQCSRHTHKALHIRTFSTTPPSRLEVEQQTPPPPPPNDAPPPAQQQQQQRDPYTVSTRHAETQLLHHQRRVPIGSRRRRAAMASTTQIPFSQLPYQCFQEARAYLKEDRDEKLGAIQQQRERIERLRQKSVPPEYAWRHENRVRSMLTSLEELKIQADINDPIVKKTFEDGQGDMSKPIYRHLADKQWRAYKRLILMQRITQMNVIPDVLPTIDPTVSTDLAFPIMKPSSIDNTPRLPRLKRIQHGDFVDSALSENAPTLYIQPYDKGTRLVTIAVVNADVPNVEKDGFDYRCHFLAVNIPISPTDTRVQLGQLGDDQVVLPWLPAWAQKGAPYQRMSVFILQQAQQSRSQSQAQAQSQPQSQSQSPSVNTATDSTSPGIPLDAAAIRDEPKYSTRLGFKLRSLVDRFALQPVGVDLFRTKWDGSMEGVMQRAGIVGWDVEFKRKRIEPLPYARKEGGRYR
ncbi:mitochondrial 54S ribosomal protein YmL35 [Recurvomyces mirabilis]|uniref:Mitochondrial 54S ribosomal protein YmL35 n=1 Tax=Recurvomyces mirabilis TaxID=574656 RepID=A0AAE0WXX8_9PEZI|nr:mitochondrial 54S ribosomal protein YmL35 [Recurvomyces mirabilis]KAK5161998.1 mitochondrial 54S ribosomal protein YmL35 [Recurvomyces mirabilis]